MRPSHVGDRPLLGAGVCSWGLLPAYFLVIWALSLRSGGPGWVLRPGPGGGRPPDDEGEDSRYVGRLRFVLVAAAALILVAGYLLSRTGSVVAERSGLGPAFFGATFVALATSLPEISTMLGAVRLRRYEMALGDIFGGNLFNAALMFLIDLMAPGAPVLKRVGAFSAFGALFGLVLTATFLAGAMERRDRTMLRMGWDSLAAILIYAAGVGLFWQLRDSAGG